MFKLFFLPDTKNLKRSFALLPHSLIGYVLFLSVILFTTYFVTYGNVLGYASDININDLLKYTNSMRNDSGLHPVKINPVLSKAAEKKAEDMFKYDYWAHTSPNNKEPWDFIHEQGYDYVYAGENLAVDFGNSKAVVNAWYNSPSHRDNLLSDKYSEIGFAVVNGELQGRNTTLVVQMFGYPRTPLVQEVKNEDAVIVDVSGTKDVLITLPNPQENEGEIPVTNKEPVIEDGVLIQREPLTQYEPVVNSMDNNEIVTKTLNSSGLLTVSKVLAMILGAYLVITFAIDGYYMRKHGGYRISGHTILHILMLIFAIIGIWYSNIGLVL